VLIEPEIPANAGNIGRTCVGLNCHLHFVGKLGFELSDKHLKRAGLDYWPHLQLTHHASWQKWWERVPDISRVFFFSTKVQKTYDQAVFKRGDWLVFGKETAGLGAEILSTYADQCLTIPMVGPIRSLNLSNSVAIALYEAFRQVKVDSRI
jgi:tRNA (cytidine/uridine-2'-O-)-methyltransferase